MFVKQSDLFWGLNKSFVKNIMDITKKEDFETGTFLFHEGDPTNQFYILIRGRVKLRIGEPAKTVYTVNHAGESFGWSSLIGRDIYSASAECTAPTKLLKIEKIKLQEIINEDHENGLHFYKHLSVMLGNRLILSYQMNAEASHIHAASSYSTGQLYTSQEVQQNFI